MTRFPCPECRTPLRMAAEVPAGKAIKCPKCGASFVPSDTAPAEPPPEPRERRRPRGRKPQPKSNTGVIVLASAGLVLLAGIIIGAIVLVRSLNKDHAVASASTATTPAATVPTSTSRPSAPEYTQPTTPTQPEAPPSTEPDPPRFPTTGPARPSVPDVTGPNRPTEPAKPSKPTLSGKEGIEIGDLAMEINASDIDGKKFKLSDYRGKVVLLDFWGNW